MSCDLNLSGVLGVTLQGLVSLHADHTWLQHHCQLLVVTRQLRMNTRALTAVDRVHAWDTRHAAEAERRPGALEYRCCVQHSAGKQHHDLPLHSLPPLLCPESPPPLVGTPSLSPPPGRTHKRESDSLRQSQKKKKKKKPIREKNITYLYQLFGPHIIEDPLCVLAVMTTLHDRQQQLGRIVLSR